MEQLIKDLNELIEKKVDNHELKRELSTVCKMLKNGFEKKTTGMEKIPKLFASNDEKKITKFYDTMANEINSLKVLGSFDKFSTYLNLNYGITITFNHEDAPNNSYIRSPKKFKKFQDLYSMYYLEDAPRNANEAISKILNSLDAITKEYIAESCEVKDSLKIIIEKQTEHSPTVVKTVDKILTNAKIKEMTITDASDSLQDVIDSQQQGIDLVLKVGKSDDQN